MTGELKCVRVAENEEKKPQCLNHAPLRRLELYEFFGGKEEQGINHGGRVKERTLSYDFCKKEKGSQAVKTGMEFK